MGRIIVIASACLVLIASGVVHGLWTDRWSDQADLGVAAQNLQRLPMALGAWHGSDVEMEDDPRSGLAGMIARHYVHAVSGKAVTLFLACGRSGPVCTHTPDVCYAGNGYEVEPPKRFPLTSASSREPSEFWTARFVKDRTAGKIHLPRLLVVARLGSVEDCRQPASDLCRRESALQNVCDPRDDDAR